MLSNKDLALGDGEDLLLSSWTQLGPQTGDVFLTSKRIIFVSHMPRLLQRGPRTFSIPLVEIVRVESSFNFLVDSLQVHLRSRRYHFTLYKWLPLPFLHDRGLHREWLEAINSLLTTQGTADAGHKDELMGPGEPRPWARLGFGVTLAAASLFALSLLLFDAISPFLVGLGLVIFVLALVTVSRLATRPDS